MVRIPKALIAVSAALALAVSLGVSLNGTWLPTSAGVLARMASPGLVRSTLSANPGLAGAASALAALARQEPVCPATFTEVLQTNAAHYRAGDIVEVTGTGYASSCAVQLDVTRPDGATDTYAVATDAGGNLGFSYPLGTLLGEYLVSISGQDGVGLGGAIVTSGPVVTTDKGDYLPGEAVEISAAGFPSWAALWVQVTRPNGVTDSTSASSDEAGNFALEYLLADGKAQVGDYKLEVFDQNGAVVASNGFTDAGIWVRTLGTAAKEGANSGIPGTCVPAVAGVCTATTLSLLNVPQNPNEPVGVGVPVGHTVVVAVTKVASGSAVSCSDSTGANFWTVDLKNSLTNVSLFVCSSRITTFIPAGGTITATFPSDTTVNAATFNEFQGFLSPTATDGTNTGSGTGSSVNSGNITTTQANDLLFGVVGISSGATFTPTAVVPPWNAAGSVTGPGSGKSIYSRQRPVFSTGTYSLLGTTSGSGAHVEAIVAYRLETTAPTSAITFPVDSTTYNSGTWTGSITGTASDGGAGVSGVGVSIKDNTANLYWNGSSFASASEFFNAATGTTSWSYALAVGNLTSGHSYTVRSQAKDDANNTETPGVGVTFTYANTNTIEATVTGGNGSISPAGAVSVSYGANQTFTITADPNHHVADVLVDGVSVGAVTSYTFTNVTVAHTIAASFAMDTRTITASAGANGSISPSGAVSVTYGANQTFNFTPAANYHVATVTVDGSPVAVAASYTFTNVTVAHTIAASFAIDTRTITASAAANGAISPAGAVSVAYGANQAFTITPDANYHVADVLVDGVSVGAVTSYTFTNVTATHTIAASFAMDTRTITASAGANGSISPSGAVSVSYGANQTFNFTPAATYHVADVLVDGVSVGAVTSYTFTNVTATHTIAASFAIDTYTLTYTAGANGSIVGTSPQTVNHGANGSLVTATPGANYHFVGWSDGYPTAARTDLNVTANLSVTASFAIDTYTLTYTAGANGSIVGTSPQTVNHGASGSLVTAVPNTGYHFVSWSDGLLTAARTDSNVTADITVSASFAINTYTLTYTAGAGGSITGTLVQAVNYGASGSQVMAVAFAGYHFTGWSDGVTTAARTALNVTANVSVTANFVIDTYTLTGFFQPVDAMPTVNTVKGGSTVPLKFTVFVNSVEKTTTTGLIFGVWTIPCSGTSTETPLEYTTSGGTSLRWDATSHQFIQNWQTPKAAGACYIVRVTAPDNSVLTAQFKTK
jgi:hypothetical protein